MTKIYQRFSKTQTNGKLIHETTTRKEAEHWLNAEIRRVTHSFLSINENNRNTAASECFNVPKSDVTDSMARSPEVFNHMYERFSQYYVLIDEPTYTYNAN